MIRKYLIIGSGPYIEGWFKDNGHQVLSRGFDLVAINNAWAVSPDYLSMWFHSSDFYAKGHLRPKDSQKRSWIEVGTDDNHDKEDVDVKYNYKFRGSGTMILNVLTHLLNRSLFKGEKCCVALAGCDCVYDGDQSHFYGNGSPDPLRFGPEYLTGELERIKGFYEAEEFKIYNIGGQDQTLLPFERKSPSEL